MSGQALRWLAVIQALLIAGLVWAVVYFGRDEAGLMDDEAEEEAMQSPSLLRSVDGANVVVVSRAAQTTSGITTARLVAAVLAPARAASGEILALDGLLELRARMRAADAEVGRAQAASALAQKSVDRLARLNTEGRLVSDRELEAARTSLLHEQAALNAATAARLSAREQATAAWGEALGRAGLSGANIDKLLDGSERVVQVVMPVESGAEFPPRVELDLPLGAGVIEAKLIGASPRADAAVPGRTAFYRAPGAALRPGMRVALRLQAETPVQGVAVPRAAILWYAGRSWVYLRRGEDQFFRRPLDIAGELPEAYFATALSAGAEVVISGAQLLLSEELKYQIKNENED